MSEDRRTREFDLESIMDLADIIEALQDTDDDRLLHFGLTAADTWDEVDDPVLLGPNGTPVGTWREGYPYDERISPRGVRADQAPAADRAAQDAGVGQGVRGRGS